MSKLGLVRLITEIGDANIKLQNLDQCADTLDWSAKKGITRVTFGTEIALTPDGTERLGLVVWLDRDVVKAIMAKARGDHIHPATKGKDEHEG